MQPKARHFLFVVIAFTALRAVACGGGGGSDMDADAADAPWDITDGLQDADAEPAPDGVLDPDVPADPPVDKQDDPDGADEPDGAEDRVYPGATWEFRTPAEAGMDAAGLEAFGNFVGGRGCVVRGGTMVYTWGDQGLRADVASACKPFYSHFLFAAVESGTLAGDSALVVDYEPGLTDLNAGLGYKDRGIEWRHLANQISCYGVVEAPSAAYDYSDYNMALFFDTLFLNVYGASWDSVDGAVLHPMLTDILQCEDDPTFMTFGTSDRPGRVGISVRDFARFGLLYLRMGRWMEIQVLSPEHVATLTTSPLDNGIPRTSGDSAEMIPGQRSIGGGNNQTDHMGSYSYAWWTNGVDRDGNRHWPDAPLDAYGAFGHGGPRAMIVIPSLDIVVSWNDADVSSRESENEALRLVAAAAAE
jgi:hypothetical protein